MARNSHVCKNELICKNSFLTIRHFLAPPLPQAYFAIVPWVDPNPLIIFINMTSAATGAAWWVFERSVHNKKFHLSSSCHTPQKIDFFIMIPPAVKIIFLNPSNRADNFWPYGPTPFRPFNVLKMAYKPGWYWWYITFWHFLALWVPWAALFWHYQLTRHISQLFVSMHHWASVHRVKVIKEKRYIRTKIRYIRTFVKKTMKMNFPGKVSAGKSS